MSLDLTRYLVKGKDPSAANKLDKNFQRSLQAMMLGMPANMRLEIFSGYRSVERQRELYAAAVKKYGAKRARHWVAPPGRSRHNRGIAVDLRFSSPETRKWVHANAAKYGLYFPMAHEPWHIEPIGSRGGTRIAAKTRGIKVNLEPAAKRFEEPGSPIAALYQPTTKTGAISDEAKSGDTVEQTVADQTPDEGFDTAMGLIGESLASKIGLDPAEDTSSGDNSDNSFDGGGGQDFSSIFQPPMPPDDLPLIDNPDQIDFQNPFQEDIGIDVPDTFRKRLLGIS